MSPAPSGFLPDNRPALTVDLVIFSLQEQQLKLLLVKRGEPPYKGYWALPGGFVRMRESLDEAAARALAEETGLADAYLEQLYTYGEPDRDPRGRIVTVAYFALIPGESEIAPGQKAAEAQWFDVSKLPRLAFDHANIAAYTLRRLRYKLEYTALGFQLLPEKFTLSELQAAYEVILGETLDKRNFRRRILEAKVIEATRSVRRHAGEGRPARLYRYRPDAVAEVKARRLFP